MKPEIKVLSLIASWLFIGVAIAQSDKTILNRALDGDLKLQVNDGGVATDALIIEGSTTNIGLGIAPLAPFHLSRSGAELRVSDTTDADSASPKVTFYQDTSLLGFIGDTASLRSAMMLGSASGKELMFFTDGQNTSTGTPRMKIGTDGGVDIAAPTSANALMTVHQESTGASGAALEVINASGSGGTQIFTVSSGSPSSNTDKFAVTTNTIRVDSTNYQTGSPGLTMYVDGQSPNQQIRLQTSTIRHKENIADLDSEVDTSVIYSFRPVIFNRKNDESKRREIGLIAEEVNDLIPQIVVKTTDKNDEDHIQGLRFSEINIMLLAEVQKLKAEIEELKSKL